MSKIGTAKEARELIPLSEWEQKQLETIWSEIKAACSMGEYCLKREELITYCIQVKLRELGYSLERKQETKGIWAAIWLTIIRWDNV